MLKEEFPGTKFLLGPGLHRVAPGVEEVRREGGHGTGDGDGERVSDVEVTRSATPGYCRLEGTRLQAVQHGRKLFAATGLYSTLKRSITWVP